MSTEPDVRLIVRKCESALRHLENRYPHPQPNDVDFVLVAIQDIEAAAHHMIRQERDLTL